jgi:hypothetical protein
VFIKEETESFPVGFSVAESGVRQAERGLE